MIIDLIDETDVEHSITDNANFEFVGINGIGVAEVRRLTQDSTTLDGTEDRGWRLEPRTITLTCAYKNATYITDRAIRHEVCRIFSPTQIPLRLKITRKDGNVRMINCFLEGDIDFPQSNHLLQGRQDFTITLLCPDPIFYDPILQVVQTSATGTGVGYVVTNANNDGSTWYSEPLIEMIGPVNGNIHLFHANTGASLQLDPTTDIPAGDKFIFDFAQGAKTVVNAAGDNKITELRVDSFVKMFDEFLTYHRKWMNIFAGGGANNQYQLYCENRTLATALKVSWYKRYISA